MNRSGAVKTRKTGKELSMREIISQVESLAAHCKSMIDGNDPDDIWKADVAVLNAVIQKLEGECCGSNAAEIIRRILEKEKVKQTELAERMGCMRQNVSQMLTHGTVNMRYDSFYRMAEALGYEIILRKK